MAKQTKLITKSLRRKASSPAPEDNIFKITPALVRKRRPSDWEIGPRQFSPQSHMNQTLLKWPELFCLQRPREFVKRARVPAYYSHRSSWCDRVIRWPSVAHRSCLSIRSEQYGSYCSGSRRTEKGSPRSQLITRILIHVARITSRDSTVYYPREPLVQDGLRSGRGACWFETFDSTAQS